MKALIVVLCMVGCIAFLSGLTAPASAAISSGLNPGSGAFVLWNGESALSQAQNILQQGILNSNNAFAGSFDFLAQPDRDHAAIISLIGQPAYRKDFSHYDTIEMAVKFPSNNQGLQFTVSGWPYTSKTVNLNQYVAGDLGGGYKLIKIPISALSTNNYSLQTVEMLFFSLIPGDSGGQFNIDDIFALKSAPSKITSATPLSNSVIQITTSDQYDMSYVLDTSKYTLSSSTDSSFSSGIHPVSVGREFHLTDFLNSSVPAPNMKYSIYLVFDKSMQSGSAYTLSVSNIRDVYGNDFSSPQSLNINFNDKSLIDGSVQVNQVGYLPNSQKFAYVGNYLGDAGPMPVSAQSCEIHDASNDALVVTKQLRNRGIDSKLSGNNVYDCDFSDVTQTGSYYVYVPGVGRSYTFNIDPNVYADVAQKVERLYYYQRAGITLDSQFAGQWARAAGTVYGDSHAQLSATQPASPLYDGEPVGSSIDLSHGWYDAGDYGKYVLTAAPTLFYLFTAYELYPQKFSDSMNIPESGNHVPDVLDETKWETDWLRNMQAPDGGVYDREVTTQWGSGMPADDTATRYVAEKTTYSTAAYAAALAMAYREFKPYWPDYANDLLARSQKAWNYLETHPQALPAGGYQKHGDIGGGDYVDPNGDTDSRAWAAAELYKSTGDQKYQTAFMKYWTQQDPMYGSNDFQDHQQKASWAYATTNFSTDASAVQKYLNEFKGYADTIYSRTYTNYYRDGYRSDVPQFIGWGSFAKSSTYSYELIRAYYLLHNSTYLSAAQVNLDAQLGANPQSQSYITGVGSQSPQDPLHTPSIFDNIAAPVPGIAVYGPANHLDGSNAYGNAAESNTNLYPSGANPADSYPLLRRYIDTHELVEYNEFSIGDSAPGVGAFAYFGNPADNPVNPPVNTGTGGNGNTNNNSTQQPSITYVGLGDICDARSVVNPRVCTGGLTCQDTNGDGLGACRHNFGQYCTKDSDCLSFRGLSCVASICSSTISQNNSQPSQNNTNPGSSYNQNSTGKNSSVGVNLTSQMIVVDMSNYLHTSQQSAFTSSGTSYSSSSHRVSYIGDSIYLNGAVSQKQPTYVAQTTQDPVNIDSTSGDTVYLSSSFNKKLIGNSFIYIALLEVLASVVVILICIPFLKSRDAYSYGKYYQ